MGSNFLKHTPQDKDRFSARQYYAAVFHATEDHSQDNSQSPPFTPVDDPSFEDDETGYYSPAIYTEDEEYYGSPPNQSEDDALILFTTSFLEEEVIRKCIDEIDPDYLQSKEWELRWLAAKVRFRI